MNRKVKGVLLKQKREELLAQILNIKKPQEARICYSIIDAGVTCFSRQKTSQVTLKSIAREAGISVKTVKKYYSSVNEMRPVVALFVRKVFQQLAIEKLAVSKSPREQFINYFEACFLWIDFLPSHFNFWLYLVRCTRFDPKIRQLNTELVDMGTQRIAAMVLAGQESHQFKSNLPANIARDIQVYITGVMLSETTEEQRPDQTRKGQINFCLSLLGSKLLQ